VTAPELKKTPLHAEHLARGARMVPFAGWDMPVQYRGVSHEHQAVRQAAGVFDVSHMGEITLTGPGAGASVQRLVTNDAGRLGDGRALYTCACNDEGTILDDLIVYRLAAERWLVVCNASNRDKMVPQVERIASDCDVVDQSDDMALVALQGPRALAIAARSPGSDGAALADLAPFGVTSCSLFDVACTVARTGYTGEDGVEIFCDARHAVALWRALLAAGAPDGLEPAGLAARDTLRLEARLALYGNDIDETTNPFEAGLAWTVKLDKGDFVGKAALERIKQTPLTRRLVGFEMVGRGIARHGYPILASERGVSVGTCTSGSPSPTLGKNIGLGYVPAAMSAVGTRLWIDCRGRAIEAVVVTTPFYKRPTVAKERA
jgi:aminomethyltransferase